MANKRKDGPHWVKAWIADLSMLTDSFRDMNTGAVNFEALGKEEYLFRMALSRKDFSLSTRAKKVWDEAVGPYNQRITAANKKSPQDAPNGNAGVDMSDAGNGAASKSPTSCDQFTADGDIREGADVSTTVSRNMRRVPQNEAPAHGFSGGRTAQGTMSRSPEAAAQSGKDYDQVPDQVSTDEARESRQVSATADALVNQTRAGAGAQALESPSSLPSPVRNLPRNKEEVRLFAIDNGLDVDDANDWAEMNLRERHGRDKDGKPIRNWKGAILNYCKAMAAKRETA